MTGMGGPGAAPTGDAIPDPNADPNAPPGGMENLLRVGQQMAEQMQRANPDLVNQLRNQFQEGNPPPGDGDNQNS